MTCLSVYSSVSNSMLDGSMLSRTIQSWTDLTKFTRSSVRLTANHQEGFVEHPRRPKTVLPITTPSHLLQAIIETHQQVERPKTSKRGWDHRQSPSIFGRRSDRDVTFNPIWPPGFRV